MNRMSGSKFLPSVKNAFLAFAALLVSGAFISCASLQQDIIRFSETDIEYLQGYEETLVSLDSRYFLGEASGSAYQKECKDFISTLDNQIASMGINNAVLSRLYAIQGRAYLLNGKKSKAEDCYKKAVRSYKGDAQGIVLSYRLGQTKDLDDANIVSICNNKALLTLEKALSCYENADFSKSAALFDSAFISLDSYYKDNYSSLRNIAWDLRGLENLTSSKSIQKLLGQTRLTTGQMLLLAQEITDLLLPYTQGKTLKEADLYKKTCANYLLTSVSGVGGDSVMARDEVVTRILCARFLWNVYCGKRNMDPIKYSPTYRNMRMGSPVEDLDLLDSDFDAVLGCIENEIINMKDGISFNGQEIPSAIEVCRMLQAADRKK